MAKKIQTPALEFSEKIYQSARKGKIEFGEPTVTEEPTPENNKLKIETTSYVSGKLESKAHIRFDVIRKEGKTKAGLKIYPRYIMNVMKGKTTLHQFSGTYARRLSVFLTRGPSKKRTVKMADEKVSQVTEALSGIL